jgi:hypothetical protein
METIVNRVEESGLIQLDLAVFRPKIALEGIDLGLQLYHGLILKEKDFRSWINEHDWQQYSGKAVYVFCSADAIIPTWSYMLIASKLVGIAHTFLCGSRVDLEKQLIKEEIAGLDVEAYTRGRIIIKGCSDIACPEFAMTELIKKLQPVAQTIMYGEPCSTVPIFKQKR